MLFVELQSAHNHWTTFMWDYLLLLYKPQSFRLTYVEVWYMRFDNACITAGFIKNDCETFKPSVCTGMLSQTERERSLRSPKIHHFSSSLVSELGLCTAAHDSTPKPLIHQQQELLSRQHFWEIEQEQTIVTKQQWWCLTHSECLGVMSSSTFGYNCLHRVSHTWEVK